VYGFLLFLESIPLPKACASHIENILSKSPETWWNGWGRKTSFNFTMSLVRKEV